MLQKKCSLESFVLAFGINETSYVIGQGPTLMNLVLFLNVLDVKTFITQV
jgi:hypothetical protein